MTKPFEVFFVSGNDGYSGDFRRFVRVCLLDCFLKLLVQAFFALDEAELFFSCLSLVLPPVRTLYRADYLETACESLLH